MIINLVASLADQGVLARVSPNGGAIMIVGVRSSCCVWFSMYQYCCLVSWLGFSANTFWAMIL